MHSWGVRLTWFDCKEFLSMVSIINEIIKIESPIIVLPSDSDSDSD